MIYIVSLNLKSGLTNSPNNNTHLSNNCDQCHSMIASINDVSFSSDRYDRQCRECHFQIAVNKDNEKNIFHSDMSKSCQNCHSYHNSDLVVASGKQFRFEDKTGKTIEICKSCHNSKSDLDNLSESHREASIMFHTDSRYLKYISPSEACMFCHSKMESSSSQTLAIGENEFSQGKLLKFYQHASHPYGIDPTSYQLNKSSNLKESDDFKELNLPNGKLECQTCHNLTSGSDNLLEFNGNYAKLCKSCHTDK